MRHINVLREGVLFMGYFYVEEFNPKKKKYYFNNCTENFCYKTRHGICSFDLSEAEIRSIPTEEYSGKDNVNYCKNIYKSILKNGQQLPAYITSNKCGHYTFHDGQHRVCIASKKGVKLRAQVNSNDDICNVCYRENKIQNSIKYVDERLKITLPRKNIFDKIRRIEPQNSLQASLDKLKNKLSDYQLEKQRNFRKF